MYDVPYVKGNLKNGHYTTMVASIEVISYVLNQIDEDGNEGPITCAGISKKTVL